MKKSIEYKLTATKSDVAVNKRIRGAEDAAEYARQFFFEDLEIFESVFLILVNSANTAVGYAKISQGGVCGSIVDKKIVCKYAVDSLASGVILVHNHPSGNMKPSREDEAITRGVADALRMVDSRLFDHIIITANGYYSFADEGLIY